MVVHVVDASMWHGLQPNSKRGKSALVLALRGRGSRKARAAAFSHVPNCLEILSQHGDPMKVVLELRYTHLGTALARQGDTSFEAHVRVV